MMRETDMDPDVTELRIQWNRDSNHFKNIWSQTMIMCIEEKVE